MKRPAALTSLLLLVVAATTLVLRPSHDPSPQAISTVGPPATATAAPRISRRQIDRQHDTTPDPLERAGGLLEVARIEPWEAHGLAVLVGGARPRRDVPQEIWVLPRRVASLPEIGTAVNRICRELRDRCAPRSYRFVVRTAAGSVALPDHLIHPTDRTGDPR